MFNRYTRLTALLVAVIPLLIACQQGSPIFTEFPNTATNNQTDNCDDSLNGDWILQNMYDNEAASGTIPAEIKNRAFIRFNIDRGCDKNTFTFAFKEKGKLDPRAVLSSEVQFPIYKKNSFFSINLKTRRNGRNRYLIFKYHFLDNDTLEIFLANKNFMLNAVKKKLISGIVKIHGAVNITASPAQMDRFIGKYSDSMFSIKLVYIRTQQTPWSFKKTVKTF